jgi:hypothetical protein
MFKLFQRETPQEKMKLTVIKQPIKIPSQPTVQNSVPFPKHLAKNVANFKHVLDALTVFWGTEMFREYAHKLLLNDEVRPTRQGFSYPVMQELTKLVEWHDVVFPQYKPKADPWDDVKPRG